MIVSEFSQWVASRVNVLRSWDLKYHEFPTTDNILAYCPVVCSEEQRQWAKEQLEAAMEARSNSYWNVT